MLTHAISELCYTIDDASAQIAEAHEETRKAIDQLSAAIDKQLKEAARA
jgi:methyl-accepting chemotaxis protein